MATGTLTGAFFGGASLVISVSTAASFNNGGHLDSYNQFTIRVDTTGSPASYSIQMQASLDNSHWFNFGSAITTDGTYTVNAGTNTFVPYIRANITAVSGGTSPTIFMYWVASS